MTAQTTILAVDDEPDLLDNIGLALETEGYRVLTARDGAEALQVLEKETVDLVLADIAMPQMNGYQLYQEMRQNPGWVAIPFILLSARRMDSDIRYGKELGVDDYLTKPIQLDDLLASVKGKLLRAEQLAQAASSPAPSPGGPGLLCVGCLQIDSQQYRVSLGDREIRLSTSEFALLEHMAQHADKLLSAQELVKVTHELDADPIEAGTLIRPLIRSLRRKLGYPVGEMGCIENVRGVGYRLAAHCLSECDP